MTTPRDRNDEGPPDEAPPDEGPPDEGLGLGVWVLIAAVVTLVLLRAPLTEFLAGAPAVGAYLTVFVAIALQALPFLVLGVTISAAIAAFVPAESLSRLLPKKPALAVPVAAAGGAMLPGCECASVPVAGAMIRRGLGSAASLTFLLAAPALNPIVMAATAVAFPGNHTMVFARFVASFLVAAIMGWFWIVLGKDHLIRLPRRHEGEGSKLRVFLEASCHDFLHAGGFLVLGAAIAAALNVLVPRTWVDAVGGHVWLGVLFLAALAVLMAICSEADAVIAASMASFSPTAQLAFMVVGPVVDLKLIAMQIGTFGRRFTAIFAPVTFLVAIGIATLVGTALL